MSDMMCIRGYGARMNDLRPYVDLRKLDAFVEKKIGITPEYDFFIDEELDRTLNRLDCILADNRFPDGLGILDLADSRRLCECLSNNRAEWFFLLPSCMPWEFSISNWPKTIEEAERILLNAMRHFLKDDAADADVTACFTFIDDIS